jgi:hypothetical protein
LVSLCKASRRARNAKSAERTSHFSKRPTNPDFSLEKIIGLYQPGLGRGVFFKNRFVSLQSLILPANATAQETASLSRLEH